jgi:hypothetical protein
MPIDPLADLQFAPTHGKLFDGFGAAVQIADAFSFRFH